MAEQEKKTAATRVATREEIDLCLKAIGKEHPDVFPEGRRPGEVYAVGKEGREVFYVNVQDPKTLPAGTVYRTWIVSPTPGGEPAVSWFRSRSGDQEDAGTLPPDDDATIPS